MSTYESDHNLPAHALTSPKDGHKSKRPDMSSFYTALAHVESPSSTQDIGAVPADVDAVRSVLLDGLRSMRGDFTSQDAQNPLEDEPIHGGTSALDFMIHALMNELQSSEQGQASRKLEGVSDAFLDGLERVPKTKLKKGMDCPVCGNDFLEDEYPLVVRLPCHMDHIFDLECIAPWLKVNPTCPMDRQKMIKEKPKVEEKKDDEEEYDDMFA